MADPFLSQISMMGFDFSPSGYAFCDGQTLPLLENQALYSLVGTIYGGDGRTTVGLPDLRGRVPFSFGDMNSLGQTYSYDLGDKGGQETVTLTEAEMPAHTHEINATSTNASLPFGSGKTFATSLLNTYSGSSNLVPLNEAGNPGSTGGGQFHGNMQPYLVINFVIAISGQFPSRN